MFSDLEIKLLMNHLDRRWRQLSMISDERERIKAKDEHLKKMDEIREKIKQCLDKERLPSPEEIGNGQDEGEPGEDEETVPF
jgi:hypothetical protein